jgi:fructokinase
MTTALYGGIEAGGTKFVCATGTGPGDLHAETTIPTTTPDETIARVVGFFRDAARRTSLAAIGIGSFGPVDPDPLSATYGHITTTPKPGWANTDLAGPIRRAIGVSVRFDTDVNAAALGEHRWGAACGLDTFVYLTVGTGIGGGGMVNGCLMRGLMHPEMGHVLIPHDRQADPFAGSCPYHGDCLEGLAAAPALERRWGAPPDTLPDDHPAWEMEAGYLALGLANLILTLSPQRIIVGGGIMRRNGLIERVRRGVAKLLNGYIPALQAPEVFDTYITPPALGDRAGLLGAIALAQAPDQNAVRR